MPSALQKAMSSKDVKGLSERQVRSALDEAIGKLGRTQKAAKTMKENAGATASHLLHAAEIQGTLFMASMAEGHQIARGKSLQLGPVDARVATGVPLMVWGLVECLRGKGGGHQLAISNGLIGSAVASLGLQAGQALAEKRSASVATSSVTDGQTSAPAQLTQDGLTLQLTPEAPVQGVREVLLHPSESAEPEPRKHRIPR